MGPEGWERKKESDIVFFRLGHFNHLKMNTNSMLKATKNDVWYSVDMLVDWDLQQVSIYVDSEAISAETFFIKRKSLSMSTNAISIYNLSPDSVGLIRNI